MEKNKITQGEINANNVKSANDLLRGEPRDNKNVFDRLPELIVARFNSFVDSVVAKFTGYYTKDEVDTKETALADNIKTKADADKVYTKSETYTKDEVVQVIDNKVVALSAGDMARGIYDTNKNGIVDDAEKLGGKLPEYYARAEDAVATYTQSADILTGSGANGKFKATASGTYTAFTIGGASYAVKAGSETEIELTSGVWYSFILDTGAKTINFKAGGAGLNFKIVGGTTQPTSPQENTIWINTDTAIGEWQFSATEPTTRADGTALQSGDVWIKTHNKSPFEFNALKKNSIKVCMGTVLQYIGGAWTEKYSALYKDSKWQQVYFYLYSYGNEANSVTGGWKTYTNSSKGSITKNAEDIFVSLQGVSGLAGFAVTYTAEMIDLTDISTLVINNDWIVSNNYNVYFGVTKKEPITVYTDVVVGSTGGATAGIANKGHMIDVTDLTGEYYVYMSSVAGGVTSYLVQTKLKEIYML